MPIHLTIKNENRPNPRTMTHKKKGPLFLGVVVVAGEMIFVVGDKGSPGVKNLLKRGLECEGD